jgi:hypothetical protein
MLGIWTFFKLAAAGEDDFLYREKVIMYEEKNTSIDMVVSTGISLRLQ